MSFGLKQEVIEQINKSFLQFPEIEEVIIYGSRAKGNYRPGSDIDFTIKGRNLNHNLLNKIDVILDDLLLPYIIDLSLYDNIRSEELLEHINRAGKSFYKNKI